MEKCPTHQKRSKIHLVQRLSPTGFPVGDFLRLKSFLLDSYPSFHNKGRAKLLTNGGQKERVADR